MSVVIANTLQTKSGLQFKAGWGCPQDLMPNERQVIMKRLLPKLPHGLLPSPPRKEISSPPVAPQSGDGTLQPPMHATSSQHPAVTMAKLPAPNPSPLLNVRYFDEKPLHVNGNGLKNFSLPQSAHDGGRSNYHKDMVPTGL